MNLSNNSWVSEEFGSSDFGDARLSKRLEQFVESLSRDTESSLCSSFQDHSGLIGAYRFLNNPSVDSDGILCSHHEQSLLRSESFDEVFFIQDTSELDYSSQKQLKGSGPLSDIKRRGFYLDCAILLSDTDLHLGVVRHDIYARTDESFGKANAHKRKQLPIEEKESFRWLKGYRQCSDLNKQLEQKKFTYLADRESDIYEIFNEYHQNQCTASCADFVIRSQHNRYCHNPEDPGQFIRLKQLMQSSHSCTEMSFYLDSRVNLKKDSSKAYKVKTLRKARQVTLAVYFQKVTLKCPDRKKMQDIELTVVRGREVDPPDDEEPIDWILLTNKDIKEPDAAIKLLQIYWKRWQIEIFFKTLKSGCKIEKLQLKSTHAIKNAIASYLVISWRIHFLTLMMRVCPNVSSEVAFAPEMWKAIWSVGNGVKSLQGLDKPPTLSEIMTLIARFGGYCNRKQDPPPGPQVIWKGLRRSVDFMIAWQLFNQTT